MLSKIIDRLEESSALALLPGLLMAEIFGLMFQYRELVKPLVGFK